MKAILVLTAIAALAGPAACGRLQVSGKDLTYNGEKVFLSGCNFAWNNYGYDFGNGKYDGTLEQWASEIGGAGGNSVRAWVHVEGDNTPIYDSNGYVTKCDNTGDFENDVLKLLNAAQSHDVLVVLTLWNGAYLNNQNTINLIWDDSKLESYVQNCLKSLVEKIKGHPALAAIETVNEPEGSVKVESSSEYCYDTQLIGQSGAGWTGKGIPMERWLKFIGRQNQVIREVDSGLLVTLGSWGQFAQSDAFSNTRNHYSNDCLYKAAGDNSHLDFYQMHSYDWAALWESKRPSRLNADNYNLDKPLVIGEYASVCAAGTSLRDLYEYAYTHGYSGGWSWHYTATGDCSDTRDTQRDALGQLHGRTDHGTVNFNVG
ncbi:mannan endo-1,4-beta-mannosidase-like [Macrobrachium rosenbergii]|uniref:mannan endo-1,4-beta-mannosidase-like n=1 Tax=Macrobrachium rosenbergii TaxID=79674 RepID=UPI0034D53E2B